MPELVESTVFQFFDVNRLGITLSLPALEARAQPSISLSLNSISLYLKCIVLGLGHWSSYLFS